MAIPEERPDADPFHADPHRATGASLIALLFAITSFVGVMLLHLVRGDIDPVRRVMSEYANGSHGRIMTVVFYGFGVCSLALAIRMRHAFAHRGPTKLVPVLLAVAGICLIASGVFEVERPMVPDTIEEVIHSDASVAAFVLLIAAMLVLALACLRDPRWWSYRWTGAGLAIAGAALAMATPLSAGPGWSGAVQRMLGLTVLLWFLLTALHVRGRAFRPA